MARGGAGGGFYAVARGRSEGIYKTWCEAEALVKGYGGAKFKKFATLHEAQAFLSANSSQSASASAPVHSAGATANYRNSSNASNDGYAGAQASSRKHARASSSDVGSAAPPAKRAHVAGSSDSGKPPTYYAVAEGHNTGVVSSWPQVLALTEGFARPVYRKFTSRAEAEAFLTGYALTSTRREPNGGAGAPESRLSTDTGVTAAVTTSAAPQQSNRTAGDGVAIADTTNAAPSSNAAHTSEPRAPLLPERFWYAVAKGRRTGVFETWREAKTHVDGLFSARYKKFPSREEAEAFVQSAVMQQMSTGDPDPQHTDSLVAFCDGSALQNGRRNCAAGFACVFPHRPEWNVAKKLVEPRATNNRAEYFAALEALTRANTEDPAQHRPLFIFSDSMLLIRSMTEWVDNWRRKNWCKADGAPVLNRDILEQLVAAKGERRVVWRHVKAHTGKSDWQSKWNDVADREARSAASR